VPSAGVSRKLLSNLVLLTFIHSINLSLIQVTMDHFNDPGRQEVEDLLCCKIKYGHQFQGRNTNPDISRLLDLCEDHPSLALQVYTEERFRPLEFMITRRLSLDTIREFSARHPHTLALHSESSITEGTPLHVACDLVLSLQYTCELIPYLISMYPQAASAKDSEGNLPLHKLLRKYSVRLRRQILHERMDCIITEIQALLLHCPAALTIEAPCTAGMVPLEFVLSIHSNILHPRLVKGMVEHAPTSMTRLEYEGSLGSPGVLTLECAQALTTIMPQIRSIEWNLARSAEYVPAAFACFFQSFQMCQCLEELDITLPTRILVEHSFGYMAVVQTIPKLRSLQKLNFSFSINRVPEEEGRERIAALAVPIACLIRRGKLREFAIYSSNANVVLDPIPILDACIHSRLQTLELRCPQNVDLTSLLVDVLSSEKCSKLENLALKNARFQCRPFLEALARNVTLRSLRAPNILMDDTIKGEISRHDSDARTLSQVLKLHNTTLISVYDTSGSHANWNTTAFQFCEKELEQVQYYTILNQFGRGVIRRMDCTRERLVAQLIMIMVNPELQHKEHGVLLVTYGILREVPVLWVYDVK